MTTLAPIVVDRSTFAFSADGRHAVCLSGGPGGDPAELSLESWTLTREDTRARTVPDLTLAPGSQALPLDDGRLLLFRAGGERRELELLVPAGEGFSQRRLGTISAPWGGYLLPSPGPAQLGFVVVLDDPGHSTIWRLSTSGEPPERVLGVPGALTRGVWLDGEASVLGMNQTHDGGSSGIAVDLAERSWKRIWSVSDTSSDDIVDYSPRSKVIVVSTTASGEERLGWARLGDPTVHFPETLHRPGYVRHALALDDRGERLLVHEVAGAASRLLVYTAAQDRLAVLAGPVGTVSGSACWVGDLVRFRFSAPGVPPGLATVRVGANPGWSVSRGHGAESQPVGQAAELVELPGATGPIEAIVYGGPDWRSAEHLVIALHGGPLSAWRFEFEPLFDRLAAAGVAVVAPNYRGSTGYGVEYLRAVVGDWGGPDLDDVLDLARSLAGERRARQLPGPVVLGASYGGFLALLAACREPELWPACVALAPFVSAASLHASAGDAVRARVEQLGGLRRTEDAAGPRDVLAVCAALSAPLLLMHGTRDETVPVEQSRMLRRRLVELGRRVEYVEVDSDHAGLVLAQHPEVIRRIATFCLARPRTAPSRQVGADSAHRRTEPLPAAVGSGMSQPLPTEGGDYPWRATTW